MTVHHARAIALVAVLVCVSLLRPDAVLHGQGVSVEVLLGKHINATEVQSFLQRHTSSAPEHNGPSVIDIYHRIYRNNGLEINVNSDDQIQAVHVYPDGVDGFGQFRGPLPIGVSLEDDRSTVSANLGLPDCSGGGGPSLLGDSDILVWDKFQTHWGTLHVNYQPNGKVNKFTFGLPSGCH